MCGCAVLYVDASDVEVQALQLHVLLNEYTGSFSCTVSRTSWWLCPVGFLRSSTVGVKMRPR